MRGGVDPVRLDSQGIRELAIAARMMDGRDFFAEDGSGLRLGTHKRSRPPAYKSTDVCVCQECSLPHCPGAGSCTYYLNSR